MDLTLVAAIAAIIAAVAGITSLARSFIKDRPQFIIKVFPQFHPSSSTDISRITVQVTDRSNQMPHINIEPYLEMSDSTKVYPKNIDRNPRTIDVHNMVELDIHIDEVIKTQLTNHGDIKFAWIRDGHTAK